MTFIQLLENPRFKSIFIALLSFTVIFFALNVFVIGGDDFYLLANNILDPALAALVALQLFDIWKRSAPDKTARFIWTYLMVGMVVWAVGDTIWAICALVLHVDLPYPSWADVLWVSGYFFLFMGLYAQLRAYNIRPTRQVWQNIALGEFIFVALTGYFVLLPIVQSFDPARLLESVLNILYPVLDLVLFPLSFLILSTLGDGKLAISWKIISVGFIIIAIADAIFAYITWQEIYSPGGTVNLVTSLYDFVYAMSYLVLGLGFVAYRLLTAEAPAAEASVDQPETAKNFILVSTDRDNKIISFSDNFLVLLNKKDHKPEIKGASLYKLLGLDKTALKTFETELAQRGFVDALEFKVKDADGKSIDVRLSALAVYDLQQSFEGVNMVITTPLSLGVEDHLSVESQGEVRFILSKTGNLQRQTRLALNLYFSAQMNMLVNLVHQYGGKTIVRSMRMVVNETASKNGWQIREEAANFIILDQPDITALAGTISVLLTAARAYAFDMVGMQMVNVKIDSVNAQMRADVMQAVDSYNLRLSA
jgi:hypothetical protein